MHRKILKCFEGILKMNLKLITVGILLTLFMTQTAYAGTRVQMLSDAQTFDYGQAAELQETEPQIYITASNVNLRPTPSTDGTRLALVPAGSRVEVIDFRDGEWYEVVYNGTTGFMSAEFLREVPNPFSASAASIGTVELLDWSEARSAVAVGEILTIVDVRTGMSYEIASFSNGNHADVEPITAEDTAIMLESFGGTWTWTPRPVLVIVNGRTLAASINGMPHGGSTRSGNGMNGQICLHFRGSTTHTPNGASHTRDHQNAVMEAFNTASAWDTAANELFV
jgi:hypothetical protein